MNFYKKLGFTLLTLEIVLLFFYIINIFPTFALLLLSSFLLSIFFFAFNFAFIANAEKTKLICIDLFNDYSFISKKLYFFKPENDFFTTTKELICCYIGGITIATTIIGILFRLAHYPGATVMLLLSSITSLILFAVILFSEYKSDILNSLKTEIIICLVISGFFYVNPFDDQIHDFRYRKYTQYIEYKHEYQNHPTEENYIKYRAQQDIDLCNNYPTKEDTARYKTDFNNKYIK